MQYTSFGSHVWCHEGGGGGVDEDTQPDFKKKNE